MSLMSIKYNFFLLAIAFNLENSFIDLSQIIDPFFDKILLNKYIFELK